MSSVRAFSARHAPRKKIDDAYRTTGKLRSSDHTSSRRPNGAETSNPNTSRPIGDHKTIGIDMIAATKNRLRMSAAIAAIDMLPWPPWPMTSSGERSTGAARSGSTRVAAAPSGKGSAMGSHRCVGTDWPSHANPQL
jgi:hypothetical protein